jgi:transposase-like protein
MGKPHRGKGTRELFAHGRGECPICKRYNVKVLYEMEAGEQKIKICKTCKAAIKNGTKSLPVTVTAKESEPAAEETATKTAEAAPAEGAVEAPAEKAE